MADRKHLARQLYESFSAGDREFFEEHLADDLAFSSPPDPELDRSGFFERCWPGAGRGQSIDMSAWSSREKRLWSPTS
jgi:ketosteroid isomerase-like protein